MNGSTIRFALAMAAALTAAAMAQPVNTTLPAGGSWMSMGTMTFDTGHLLSEAGGTPGQMSGPYFDTSYGVMDEPLTPWFTDNDLSAQQYIQRQEFGNLGATIPPNNPSPWQFGFSMAPAAGDSQQRFYNYGYGGTSAGDNFPQTGSELRTVTVPHWNNPNPDTGGIAADCDEFFIPVFAKITIDMGWGADEMFFDLVGGPGGGTRTRYRSTIDVDASYSVNGTGAYTGSESGEIVYSASMENNDPGGGNAYQAAVWGANATGPDIGFNTSGSRTWGAATLNSPSAGVPPNSIGTSISEITGMADMINIAAVDIVQNGGTFDVAFSSTATFTQLMREFGDADGRVSAGPGMQGDVRYEVTFEKWKAIVIPEPVGGGLWLAAIFLVGYRRR